MKFFAEAGGYGNIPEGELTREQEDEIWKELGLGWVDADGDRKISREELLATLPRWASKEPAEVKKANEAFDEIDTDKTGFLDIDELLTFWRNFDPSSEGNSGHIVAAPPRPSH